MVPLSRFALLPASNFKLAALTHPTSSWESVCICLPVKMSQTVAVYSADVETSCVESGEKSMALTQSPSVCSKTCSYVVASQTITSWRVPAAIHFPSVNTARHRTSTAFMVAISFPSSTRPTRTPVLSLLTTCSPFAENTTAFSLSINAVPSLRYAPTVVVNNLARGISHDM